MERFVEDHPHAGVRARAGERSKEGCDNTSEGGGAGYSSGEEVFRDEVANLCGKRKQVALPLAFAGSFFAKTWCPSWNPVAGKKLLRFSLSLVYRVCWRHGQTARGDACTD